MKQTTLNLYGFETNEGICRLCRKENDGYITAGLCIDCDIGISIGQWVFDEIAKGYA